MIGLFLGSALRRLLDALKWCAERPAIAVAVVSIVVAGFYYIRSHSFERKYEAARAEITQLVNERREAIAYAKKEKARIEAEQKEAKYEADKRLRIALDDGERRLRAYARSHSAKAYLPGPSAPTGEPDSPDTDAIVVTINDARICTVNTARLLNAQQWANDVYGELK